MIHNHGRTSVHLSHQAFTNSSDHVPRNAETIEAEIILNRTPTASAQGLPQEPPFQEVRSSAPGKISAGCRMIEIFDHCSTVCTDHTSGPCQIRLSEKLCIDIKTHRLRSDQTKMHHEKKRWRLNWENARK
ncbi:hypothetical protein OSTOST_02331 [Ostertagia ostertagi]